MGLASLRVYQKVGFSAVPLTWGLYATELALNFTWTPVRSLPNGQPDNDGPFLILLLQTFFIHHRISWALASAATQWTLNLGVISAFYQVDETAGLMMIPLQVCRSRRRFLALAPLDTHHAARRCGSLWHRSSPTRFFV